MSSKVEVELLVGLPGEGPPPMYFDAGRPTPWTEGFVVRIAESDGTSFVGNFQKGSSPFSTALAWPEASAAVVVASGNLFLVPLAEPLNYRYHAGSIQGALLSPGGDRLYVVDYGEILAFGAELALRWKQDFGGASYVAIDRADSDSVSISVQGELDLEDGWEQQRLASRDGAIL